MIFTRAEAEFMITNLGSIYRTFTRGAVSGNNGISIETISAALTVLSTSVVHAILALTCVSVACFHYHVGIKVTMTIASSTNTSENSRVSKVTTCTEITTLSSITHLTMAH
jgi:hypothetical protein